MEMRIKHSSPNRNILLLVGKLCWMMWIVLISGSGNLDAPVFGCVNFLGFAVVGILDVRRC